MSSCADKKIQSRKGNTVASSWKWSELWTSERSDGVGRTSEQTLHSFPQPFKQPGVTMETPLCVFPNYPNPLHILSHTHRDTHKNTKKKQHTLFGLTIPFPLPCIPTQWTLIQSHTVFPSVQSIIFDAEGFGLILTAGTRSFLTSLMARWSLILARLCVSSTVIRTWRSSLRCSQLGFPRFISSWNTKNHFRSPVWMHHTSFIHGCREGTGFHFFFLFGSVFG